MAIPFQCIYEELYQGYVCTCIWYMSSFDKFIGIPSLKHAHVLAHMNICTYVWLCRGMYDCDDDCVCDYENVWLCTYVHASVCSLGYQCCPHWLLHFIFYILFVWVSVWHLPLSVLCPAEHNLPAALDREASEQTRNVLWSHHWTKTGPHEEGTNVRTYVGCVWHGVSHPLIHNVHTVHMYVRT